ncbi:MAG: ribonuclease III [Phycisphaerales bacterium]
MTEGIIQIAQQRLGYVFKDPGLLELALTHASVADSRVESNERMEFLGDAVLGLIVCERTYQLYPHLLEGEMTKIKSTVVSRASCAVLARQIGLADCLWLGKGMRVHETLPQSLAAAVLEAAIAAIYIDSDFERVRAFVLPRVEPLIERAFESGHQENFKSILQQHAQQNLNDTPTYVVLEQRGPDHAKHFHVCVQIAEKRFPSSWGQSKKQAEQQAALLALYEMGITVVDDAGRVRVVHPAPGSGSEPDVTDGNARSVRNEGAGGALGRADDGAK